MITIENYTRRKHYELLCGWWQQHGWTPPPAVFLPRLGIVALHDGNPVAAGWCYRDGSTPLATLEWLVTNPTAHPRLSLQALNVVIDFLTKHVKELGCIAALTSARQPGLVRILEHRGFEKTDVGITHLIMLLDEKAQKLRAAAQPANDPIISATLLETGTDNP